MFRSICRLALTLLPLLSGTLAVLHAHPYDASDLHTFLNVESACACFIGIQPGVSDLDQVQAIMEQHPWISQMRYSRGMALDSGFMTWRWSGAQPDFINSRIEGRLWIENGYVEWIEIVTHVTFGELWLLKPPATGTRVPLYPQRVHQRADYGRLEARSDLACPLRPAAFWNMSVTFHETQPGQDEQYPRYRLPAWWGCL